MSASDAEGHVASFSCGGAVELCGARGSASGKSLRCLSDVVHDGTELIRVPWEHVLDVEKCISYLAYRVRQEMGTSVVDCSPSPHELRASFLLILPEVVFATALLVSTKDPQEADAERGYNSKKTRCSSPTADVMKEIGGSTTPFAREFSWVHDIISQCGDLAIPLCWPACCGRTEDERAWSASELLDLCMDRHVKNDVVQDLAELREQLSLLVGTCRAAGASQFAQQVEQACCPPLTLRKYIAWIRSRWVCFSATTTSPVAAKPDKKRKGKAVVPQSVESVTAARQFAVVPLIEMLNHHPHSRQCPSVAYGEYVSLVVERADTTATPPNRLRAGDEVFINYGPLTNTELLKRYGFLLRGSANPADGGTEVQLPEVDDSVLERFNLLGSHSLPSVWRVTTATRQVPPGVLLRVALAHVSSSTPTAILHRTVPHGESDEDETIFCGGCRDTAVEEVDLVDSLFADDAVRSATLDALANLVREQFVSPLVCDCTASANGAPCNVHPLPSTLFPPEWWVAFPNTLFWFRSFLCHRREIAEHIVSLIREVRFSSTSRGQ